MSAYRNSDDGILQVVTYNRHNLLPRYKGSSRYVMGDCFVRQQIRQVFRLYVGADSFLEKIAVRFFTLMFKESFGGQSFLKAFPCSSTIFFFSFDILGFVRPFALLN